MILNSSVDAEYQTYLRIYLLTIALTILITGIIFTCKSFKSENPEIKLKGKFLLVAFLSWSIGAALDVAVPLNFFLLTITRLLLISSAFEFYFGFLLPNWIKNHFSKRY